MGSSEGPTLFLGLSSKCRVGVRAVTPGAGCPGGWPLVTIQIEGHMSICEWAKFTEEQKTQRPFSPLSNGNNNNAYLQACEDRMKYLRRTSVLQSHNACSVDTRFAGLPEMLAKWDTGQGLSSGRCVVPEPMGAQQTWTEVTQCLG